MANFDAAGIKAVDFDNLNLSEFLFFTGAATRTATSFRFTVGGVTREITGTGLIFDRDGADAGRLIGGIITEIKLTESNLVSFTLDGLNADAASLGAFANDAQRRAALFSAADAISGSNLGDDLDGSDGSDELDGLGGNDTLDGGNGHDTLDGGTGNDSMLGGAGNDVYIVDSSLDAAAEGLNQGQDLVLSSAGFALGANIEDLTLTGTADADGAGNALANRIAGNTARNQLSGAAGADSLLGGGGADTLDGGADNDTLDGGDGADILNGGAGADSMSGGLGADVYVADNIGDSAAEAVAEAGVRDRVESSASFILGTNLEDLTLTGAAAINGTGNGLDNVMVGNAGANILDGQAGADTLQGGKGNDTYRLDSLFDVVVEAAGEGIDTVLVDAANFNLGANIENAIVVNDDLAIFVFGNDLNNQIKGGGGQNLLDGGAGKDTMAGGLGSDRYGVDDAGDTVTEAANGGVDQVFSTVSFALGANIEDLKLQGTQNLTGTGNALGNGIDGNTGANLLKGLAGDDALEGGAGADTLDGGTGNDVLLDLGGGNDVLDGGAGNDTMQGFNGDDVYIVDSNLDVVDELLNAGQDLVQSSVGFVLGENFEDLTLTGTAAINGTGNGLANRIAGNTAANGLDGGDGADTLDGGAGADAMAGGLGADVYVVDNAGDKVTEAAAEAGLRDRVESAVGFVLGNDLEDLTLTGTGAVSGTGNALANVILGNAGANHLDGKAGADTLQGGKGNDIYHVDDSNDAVIEAAGEGLDAVFSLVDLKLGGELENLTLLGDAVVATGNDLANQIIGNGSGNIIDGGKGRDTMAGGAGNDDYFVDDSGDIVTEAANAGIDRVIAGTISVTLGANIENLVLKGNQDLLGAGNALGNVMIGNAGANLLQGLTGDDILDGGAGADTLDGGTGRDSMTGDIGADTYIVDDAGDVVSETGGDGAVDTVQSSIGFTLGNLVENLTLIGSAALTGTGNSAANQITGNAAANILDGRDGNDTLNGGTGADSMIGGFGADLYIVDNAGDKASETDAEAGVRDRVEASVNVILGANLEDLTLTGAGALNGAGNALDNVILGNAAANILDGKAGADTMQGGQGNDTYHVDQTNDSVMEAGGEGVDSVFSSAGFNLGNEIENLTLLGSEDLVASGNNLANKITGNNGDNNINGNEGNDTLAGGDGNDQLAGGLGSDSMSGGGGDDRYAVDNVGDIVTEAANAGTDEVLSEISFTLGANVENLVLLGGTGLTGTGNALGNRIDGNAGANLLKGLAGGDALDGQNGADTLDGGVGNDTLTGGAGADVFDRNASGEGTDAVTDFELGGGDRLDIADLLVGFDAGDDVDQFVQAVQSGGNTVIRVDPNGAVGGAVFTDVFVLQSVSTTIDDLVAGGNLVT